jgi:hypothetical protein
MFGWLKSLLAGGAGTQRESDPIANVLARLSDSTIPDHQRTELAIDCLKNPSPAVRAAVAGEVGRLKLDGIGVMFQLVNLLLEDNDRDNRIVTRAAAKALSDSKAVSYAISSLHDIYRADLEAPPSLKQMEMMVYLRAASAVKFLRETAVDKAEFEQVLRNNWENWGD